MPKPNANGSGEAYQSWNSAQASETVKMIWAVTPVGLRPPVSASATSCCSASGAFSMSVAITSDRAGRRPGPLSLFVHLIQPFSL